MVIKIKHCQLKNISVLKIRHQKLEYQKLDHI